MCGSAQNQVPAGRDGRREALQPSRSSSPAQPGRDSRLRIGDVERDATVALLGAAFAGGYLDQVELEARTGRALAATTGGELDALGRDLPARLDPAVAATVRTRVEVARRGATAHLTSYVAGVTLMVGIWLVTAVLFGATYFWPVWPILGWGIGVVSHVLPVRRQLARTGPA